MIEQNTFTIIFGLFLLLTCRDMFFGHSGSAADVGKQDPSLHHHNPHRDGISDSVLESAPHVTGSLHGIPTIKIQFCHSCGYRQAFEEISKLLQANFPGIKMEGEYHQPNWLRQQIVNLLFVTKFATLAMIFMDVNPFNYLQMETPRLWTHVTQNKISSSLIIFFISNSIETNMMSTGAFEIFYNDYPIWSKIQTGRIPSGPELLQIVGSQYKMSTSSTGAGFKGV